MDMCVDICRGKDIHACVDTYLDMCEDRKAKIGKDMYVHKCVSMCVDMRVHGCGGMCTDLSTDMCMDIVHT